MEAQRSGSRELSDWNRGSWEAEANALTAFGSGSYADAPIHCDLSDDVLSLALLCDSEPYADERQHIVFPMISKLEDPQLCPSHSEQTQVATPEYLGSAEQSITPRCGSSCPLEDALTSIGMRQLLPQTSVSHSSRNLAYTQMQPAALPSSVSYRPYCSGAASVFVPCHDPQPLQDLFKGQPAWGFEHELLSAGSAASSGADGCVPELTQRSLSHVIIKSEACVPDYSTGGDGSPCMPPIQTPVTGRDGHMQPRVAFLKLDEESLSSDSEDRLTLKLQPSDALPLIVADVAPTFHRKQCLQRYRDKKQRRHFSHKVRYTARKLNADRRPRYKGRFIKAADLSAHDLS